MSHVDAKIIVGILTSFLLGGGMYFIGKDTVESFVIGMLGSILTLLFAIKIDVQESKNSILESIKLSKEINNNHLLKELLSVSILNHNKIDKKRNKILTYEAVESLRNYSINLSELAENKINISAEDKRVKILTELLKETKKCVYSASYPGRWKEELGRVLFDVNKRILENGVKIRRIFIIKEIDKDVFFTIKKHLEIGVECYIVVESELPNDMKKHIIVFDDFAVTLPLFDKYGNSNGGLISFDEKDIYRAKDSWDRMLLFARNIENEAGLKEFSENKVA